MQQDIDVSIIATAHRPDNWLEVCNSFITNLNIEFVFVGPNPPVNPMPANFHHIGSRVKPAQCVEIALRSAVGRYVMIFADDMTLEEAYGLDDLFNSLANQGNNFAIASCKYRQNGVSLPESSHRFIGGDESTPIMPLGGLMLRSSLNSIGGIDKRFIGVNYDLDLAMRFYAEGGTVHFGNVHAHEKIDLRNSSRLWDENQQHDRKLLNSLWLDGTQLQNTRRDKVHKYIESNLTVFSQGPRGHWRGEGNLLIEMIEDFPYHAKRFFNLQREKEFPHLRPIYRWAKKYLKKL